MNLKWFSNNQFGLNVKFFLSNFNESCVQVRKTKRSIKSETESFKMTIQFLIYGIFLVILLLAIHIGKWRMYRYFCPLF